MLHTQLKLIPRMISLFDLETNIHNFCFTLHDMEVRKKAKLRNRYNQVPQLTQDTVWESDKTIKSHIQESQETSPFQAGDQKDVTHTQDNIAKTNTKKKKKISQKSTAMEWSIRKLLEGLN